MLALLGGHRILHVSRIMVKLSFFTYFLLPDDRFSQRPKHVSSNKTDINLVVTDGLCSLSADRVSQQTELYFTLTKGSPDSLSCGNLRFLAFTITTVSLSAVGR